MRKTLRIRWGVDCVLGTLSQQRLFLNNLTLRVEEFQTLIESNKSPLLWDQSFIFCLSSF